MYCPNCAKEIASSANACLHCKADFTSPDGWRPVDAPGTWKPTLTEADARVNFAVRLVLALVALLPFLFILLLVVMFSCKEGCGSFGSLGLILLVVVGGGVVAWAARPFLHVTKQKAAPHDECDTA